MIEALLNPWNLLAAVALVMGLRLAAAPLAGARPVLHAAVGLAGAGAIMAMAWAFVQPALLAGGPWPGLSWRSASLPAMALALLVAGFARTRPGGPAAAVAAAIVLPPVALALTDHREMMLASLPLALWPGAWLPRRLALPDLPRRLRPALLATAALALLLRGFGSDLLRDWMMVLVPVAVGMAWSHGGWRRRNRHRR